MPDATISKMEIVQQEGSRQVKKGRRNEQVQDLRILDSGGKRHVLAV